MQYIGRFAPSPSGLLHFGSQVTAVGSFIQARAQHGKWLVRIEDIDPPREIAGAASQILATLEAFDLLWDDAVLYQSQRSDYYQAQIDQWLSSGDAYFCECTRSELKAHGGIYPATCKNKQLKNDKQRAVRLSLAQPVHQFTDLRRGLLSFAPNFTAQDLLIKRSDGLFAYNLAVVLDDIAQGVSEIVRGADLIDATCWQIALYHQLGVQPVRYLHLPLALDARGQKLSKQNHAPAVTEQEKSQTMQKVLQFLGHPVPAELCGAPPALLLEWAIANWQLAKLDVGDNIID
ncbi:MAG: tRNA glutamyl-Q(34) synthetase GluQRS [Vibrionaceae bacterium]